MLGPIIAIGSLVAGYLIIQKKKVAPTPQPQPETQAQQPPIIVYLNQSPLPASQGPNGSTYAQVMNLNQARINASDQAAANTTEAGARQILGQIPGIGQVSGVIVDGAELIGDALGLSGPLMPGQEMVAPDTGQVSYAGAVGLTEIGISGSKKEF